MQIFTQVHSRELYHLVVVCRINLDVSTCIKQCTEVCVYIMPICIFAVNVCHYFDRLVAVTRENTMLCMVHKWFGFNSKNRNNKHYLSFGK